MSNARSATYQPFRIDEIRQIARALTARGLTAFPVQVSFDGKHWDKKPGYRSYRHCGLLSPRQIERLHELAPTHMGLAVPPGYAVLDFDVSGKALDAVLNRLEQEYGPLPTRVRQRTPSGGRHYLLRHPWGPGMAFASRVHFKDGTEAPVDIVHAGNRFVVVYDPAFPDVGGGDLDTVPMLGEGWRAAMTYRRPQAPLPSLMSSDTGGASALGIHGRFDPLRKAAEGTRNTTLNRLAFTEAVRGNWSEEVEVACWAAARECGLDDGEIEGTVVSAGSAALTEWVSALTWLTNVQILALPRCVFQTAVVIAWKTVVTGKKVIGLSVRELSEILGVSTAACSGYLRDLVARGVLLRPDSVRGLPLLYEPTTPDTLPVLYTPPAPQLMNLSNNNDGCVFTYGDLRRTLRQIAVGRHSAFQRLGEGPVLTRECAVVLEELRGVHGMALKELSERTGLTRRRTDSLVRELQQAGLIQVERWAASLAGSDVFAALDGWALRNGVPDRVQKRADMYVEQRAERLAERERWKRDRARNGRIGQTDADLPAALRKVGTSVTDSKAPLLAPSDKQLSSGAPRDRRTQPA